MGFPNWGEGVPTRENFPHFPVFFLQTSLKSLDFLKDGMLKPKHQVHTIEPTAPALGRRPVVMPDPHSTIQEEEAEAKPTFTKQVGFTDFLLRFVTLCIKLTHIHM